MRSLDVPGSGDKVARPRFRSHADLSALDLVGVPIWLFDLTHNRMWWANRAALGLWHARTLDELRERSFADDSPAVRNRVDHLIEDVPPGGAVTERWTLYPNGQPVTVMARLTPVDLPGDVRGMLCEASHPVAVSEDRDHVRMSEATRYTPLVVSTISGNGQILSQNPAAARAYGRVGGGGVAPEEGWARRFIEQGDAGALIEQGLRDGKVEGTYRVRTLDGERWHRIYACKGRDPITGEVCLVVTESDVSDRIDARRALEQMADELEREVQRRTYELEQARRDAEAASLAKSGFLANVSHELRTPLNAIMGFAELLQQPSVVADNPERLSEYASSILVSGRLLLKLIDDILDLSRIEARRMRLHIEPVSIATVLDECRTIVAQLADSEGIALAVGPVASDLSVDCDQRALTQVILNLASNSLKFTPRGGEIRISARRAGPGEVVVFVDDTGVGIEPADLPHVIEPFAQAANPLVRRAKGHGLGLPIAKQLVELMGGWFEIVSTPGRGTRVTLGLLASAQPRQTEPPAGDRG